MVMLDGLRIMAVGATLTAAPVALVTVKLTSKLAEKGIGVPSGLPIPLTVTVAVYVPKALPCFGLIVNARFPLIAMLFSLCCISGCVADGDIISNLSALVPVIVIVSSPVGALPALVAVTSHAGLVPYPSGADGNVCSPALLSVMPNSGVLVRIATLRRAAPVR